MRNIRDQRDEQLYAFPFLRRYVESWSLTLPVRIKILSLEGTLPRSSCEELLENPMLKFQGRNCQKFPDLMIEAVLVFDGDRLHVPIITPYKHFTNRLGQF